MSDAGLMAQIENWERERERERKVAFSREGNSLQLRTSTTNHISKTINLPKKRQYRSAMHEKTFRRRLGMNLRPAIFVIAIPCSVLLDVLPASPGTAT